MQVPRELGKCPSVSETGNIFANSHLHLCHRIGTSSIICRVFVQSERAFSVGRYQESDCRVEGQVWTLLKVRLGGPGPASSDPKLSLSRNTRTGMHERIHALTHTHIDVTAVELSMPYTLSFPRSVCLTFTYLFIFTPPHFVVFHIFFYISFGKKPNSFWERAHFCQEAASRSPSRCVSGLPWVKLCCTTRKSLGAIRAGEGCSRSLAVRQFTYPD